MVAERMKEIQLELYQLDQEAAQLSSEVISNSGWTPRHGSLEWGSLYLDMPWDCYSPGVGQRPDLLFPQSKLVSVMV